MNTQRQGPDVSLFHTGRAGACWLQEIRRGGAGVEYEVATVGMKESRHDEERPTKSRVLRRRGEGGKEGNEVTGTE